MSPKLDPGQIEKCAESALRSKDASTLAILYGLAGRRDVFRLLEEAPVEKNVGIALALLEENRDEREIWLAEISKIAPESASTSILKAHQLIEQGKRDEALTEMARAATLDFSDVKDLVGMEASFWQTNGESDHEANILAREGRLATNMLDSCEEVLLRLDVNQLDSSQNQGLEVVLKNLRETLGANSSLTLMRRFQRMEALVNSGKTSDGMDPAFNHIESKVRKSLDSADPQLIDDYYKIMDKEGVCEAFTWLTGEKP
ncbi:MAG: hypothetical protein V4584_00210 [Verrucomicrobiota bacterium]